MKHVKTYKIFESNSIPEYTIWDAIDCLSQNTIEEYFNEYYGETFGGICNHAPEFVWDYVDEDKFKDNVIEDKVDKMSYEISNMNDIDYKKFFNKKFTKNNFEHFFEEKYSNMINNKTKSHDFIMIIKKEKLEEDFFRFTYEDLYYNMSAEKVAEYNDIGYLSDTYDLTYLYVDDNKVVDDYTKELNWDTKVDFVANDIAYSETLQREILKSENGVNIIFDILEDSENSDIAKDYDFQKSYIENHNDDKAESIKRLYDKFGLNSNIEKEYDKFMYMAQSSKYNL